MWQGPFVPASDQNVVGEELPRFRRCGMRILLKPDALSVEAQRLRDGLRLARRLQKLPTLHAPALQAVSQLSVIAKLLASL